jgi:hypothetical protein
MLNNFLRQQSYMERVSQKEKKAPNGLRGLWEDSR